MFDGMDASTFNNLFIERLDSPEGIQKTAAAGSAFVRAVMREVAFSRRILPPESVTRADCQRSTDHDTLTKIVDIEPNSKAFAINFRGEAEDNYIQGKRYALPFFKIESQKFQKSEGELLAYDYPITKVIEENSIKDLQAVEDSKFIEYAESAIAITGKSIASAATSIDRAELTRLFKMIDYDKLSVGCILMNTVDYDDWLVQPSTEIGSPLASEITVSGYKYESILKRKLIVTNKSEIVPAGEIWAFTEPAYLGNFFILNDTKFWIKKEADMVIWKTWEYIAEGFGNIKSIAKTTLSVPAPI
ncbi:MAG: hypothetical protein DRQ88_13295 [Epsilonproteobacteria bacterium]|nr:MAG: hypothetical protein DRQ88_13295 [Campylobacterota bacterium]